MEVFQSLIYGVVASFILTWIIVLIFFAIQGAWDSISREEREQKRISDNTMKGELFYNEYKALLRKYNVMLVLYTETDGSGKKHTCGKFVDRKE